MKSIKLVRMAIVAVLLYFLLTALRGGVQGLLYHINVVSSHMAISDVLNAVVVASLLLSIVGLWGSPRYRGIIFCGIDDWMATVVATATVLLAGSKRLLAFSDCLYWRIESTRTWFRRVHQQMESEQLQ